MRSTVPDRLMVIGIKFSGGKLSGVTACLVPLHVWVVKKGTWGASQMGMGVNLVLAQTLTCACQVLLLLLLLLESLGAALDI